MATITGQVTPGMPTTQVEWFVMVDEKSIGNGVVNPRSGYGSLSAEFRANYPGEISLLIYAVDDRGVPAIPARVTLSVQR